MMKNKILQNIQPDVQKVKIEAYCHSINSTEIYELEQANQIKLDKTAEDVGGRRLYRKHGK